MPSLGHYRKQIVQFGRMLHERGYVAAMDGNLSVRLDERRILWAAGDIVENRPALSRWHPDYAEAFAAFAKNP